TPEVQRRKQWRIRKLQVQVVPSHVIGRDVTRFGSIPLLVHSWLCRRLLELSLKLNEGLERHRRIRQPLQFVALPEQLHRRRLGAVKPGFPLPPVWLAPSKPYQLRSTNPSKHHQVHQRPIPQIHERFVWHSLQHLNDVSRRHLLAPRSLLLQAQDAPGHTCLYCVPHIVLDERIAAFLVLSTHQHLPKGTERRDALGNRRTTHRTYVLHPVSEQVVDVLVVNLPKSDSSLRMFAPQRLPRRIRFQHVHRHQPANVLTQPPSIHLEVLGFLFPVEVLLLQVYRQRSEEHTSELQSRENLVCR